MNIDEITYGEFKELNNAFSAKSSGSASSFMEVGQCYLIRTVTMIQIGRVIAINDTEIKLTDACWVADTGRFHVALEKGELSEIEIFPHGCVVSRLAIVDYAPWVHDLPTESK